eukprot:CAMPEP_0206632698 /NCGR_PEP_ID=MMETSP0325_2-20121206/69046_1 /ASSEMBLY_ACC=CAM_ASM_000347 /TAXON_ID=2866 /ORGANISM="Crypthecodinium cohnii, Strain Seligo" /LENGTH=51 /DNA_ID=CAMNT_0054158243 /DNA_START=533 /DNA_END=685 /DNA_ORIENTATION=-
MAATTLEERFAPARAFGRGEEAFAVSASLLPLPLPGLPGLPPTPTVQALGP